MSQFCCEWKKSQSKQTKSWSRTIVYIVTSQHYPREVTPTDATLLFVGLVSVTLESCLYRYRVTSSNTGRGKKNENTYPG